MNAGPRYGIGRWLLGVLAGNLLIAAFLTAAGLGGSGWSENVIFSQCIGLGIFAAVYWPVRRMPPAYSKLVVVALAILLGSVAGSLLALWLTRPEPWQAGGQLAGRLLQPVLLGLLFGVVVGNFFYAQDRIELARRDLAAERIRRLESEKERAVAELKMLQAQIEPHFLFNTLAHVVSLLDQDAAAARRMLLQLIDFLRRALRLARQPGTTLGEELALVRDYLGLLQQRMGTRLEVLWQIDEGVLTHPFPPLLLQPLVENAIRHGLEPKIAGGSIALLAGRGDGQLHVTVSDTGVGLQQMSAGGGLGLANVRSRLQSQYGAQALLEIGENPVGGVTSHIAIPLQETSR